jgi:hypothetical protein
MPSAVVTQRSTFSTEAYDETENLSIASNVHINPIKLLMDEESTKNRIFSHHVLSIIIRHEQSIELMNERVEYLEKEINRLREEKLNSPHYSEKIHFQQEIDAIQKEVDTLIPFKETLMMIITEMLKRDGAGLLNQQQKDVEKMNAIS